MDPYFGVRRGRKEGKGEKDGIGSALIDREGAREHWNSVGTCGFPDCHQIFRRSNYCPPGNYNPRYHSRTTSNQRDRNSFPSSPSPRPRGTSRTWQVVRSSDFSPRRPPRRGKEKRANVFHDLVPRKHLASTQFFSRDEISADFQNDASNFFILPFPLTISKSTVSQENHEYC